RKHARQWRCPRLTLAQHIQDALLVVDLLFALALAFLCFEGKPSPCRRCTRASTVPRSNSLRRSFVQILLEKAQQLQLNNLWSPSRPILGVSPFNIWDGLLARFGLGHTSSSSFASSQAAGRVISFFASTGTSDSACADPCE
ncbi:unnamed protein product, partial [Effrenium voratum]